MAENLNKGANVEILRCVVLRRDLVMRCAGARERVLLRARCAGHCGHRHSAARALCVERGKRRDVRRSGAGLGGGGWR